ncbi:MAG: hypothetical protein CVV24_08230 [Ignavibacteriae bacterium HGW-Ignavibacteriae-3]|nr:MAG: hypothetical protein CVV24_08230 [Ignavibacteriae bacterium HGW-Ignavibacteriae-3]
MAEQQKKNIFDFEKVKKYFPIVVFVSLTLALIFFFKFREKEIGNMLEEGKNNLLAFYAENLKPLIVQTTITDEDIFNFALFNSLPLDKQKNKILEITGDQTGKNTFIIKTASYNPSTKNYETFVRYMGMNKIQKERIDSILNSYKKEIYSSVLINDKNTVAVNPKISELQQAVLADIVSYAQSINGAKSKEQFPNYFNYSDRGNVAKLIGSAREIPQNEYFLITPDTVARTYFKWDQAKFDKHLEDIEKNKFVIAPPVPNIDIKFDRVATDGKGSNDISSGAFSFNIDTNYLKFIVPVENMNLSKTIQDSIRIKLNEAARQMKNISIRMGHGRGGRKDGKNPGALNQPELIVNPFEIATKTLDMLSKNGLFSKTQTKDWEKFGEKMDSLGRLIGAQVGDSIKMEIQRELMKTTKELKRVRKIPKSDSTYIR